MKVIFLTTQFLLLIFSCVSAQTPAPVSTHKIAKQDSTIKERPTRLLSEDCFNNIDDDGNGLTDMKDFSCYFKNISPDTCIPGKIVWASYWYKLYWVDLETNNQRIMDFPAGEFYDDITWTPEGRLYGVETFTGAVREIDPYTANTTFAYNVPGHYSSNGMVSDGSGHLYLSSFTTGDKCHLVRLDMATGQSNIIADFSAKNLQSAGDLCFLNGYLYVTCRNNIMAKVDIGTGNIQSFPITGLPHTNSGFGLITFGDGFLYTSIGEDIYRVDPLTMAATFYYKFPTYGVIFGLSNYGEYCEAPGCKSQTKITVQSKLPFCSNTGVLLKGSGVGIKGASAYTWTLPDGSKKDGDTLTAFITGKYYLKYHTMPDTCGTIDSIQINILRYPSVSIGNDTVICSGKTFFLQPVNTRDINSYLWQDGTTQPGNVANHAGLFWVEASNACGLSRDSVLLTTGFIPELLLDKDTLICPGNPLVLKNLSLKRYGDLYTWSTGQHSDSISITKPGKYWLQSSNSCGTPIDSIIVDARDSCSCKPIFPNVSLGPDATLCKYDTLVLKNDLQAVGDRNRWQNGSEELEFVARQPGIYWVDISTYCGTVRDTVIISEKNEGCDCNVYIPNAFTPNNDGKNDVFRITTNCKIEGEIIIYNRWGKIVYDSNDLLKGWDGYVSGSLQPNSVFVYILKYKISNRPGSYSEKGSVALIR